ncbi:MAG: DNA polymerase III subunit gamma/tau, partial [Hyphomicrobiales bacterium]|nr:DNA polymerase III subunit gamma/tau [Hyphomicrobiales bacterium]
AAAKPIAAAEMLLIRLAYAANLPTPDEALKVLSPGAPGASATASSPASGGTAISGAFTAAGSPNSATSAGSISSPSARPPASLRVASSSPGSVGANALRREERAPEARATPVLHRFEDVIALAHEKRDLTLAYALERDVRLVTFERGRIEFEPSSAAKDDLAKSVARRLFEWTGERWLVAVSPSPGARSVGEMRDSERKSTLEAAKGEPLVQAILERFPGAEIVTVRDSLAAREEELEEPQEYPESFDDESFNPQSVEDGDPFEFLDDMSDE